VSVPSLVTVFEERIFMLEQLLVIAIDLVAVGLLTFGLYFSRHHRRDLVAAYLGVNVGVLAVSTVLSSSTISFGLGLGLFGVLSIIRLRSYEIDQNEIAYYFASLAIGLLAGLTPNFSWLTTALIALILIVMYVGDHPSLLKAYRQLNLTIAQTFATEAQLRAHVETLVDGEVKQVSVKSVNLVTNVTRVEVRYKTR
jgi:uncharacterized protein Usg